MTTPPMLTPGTYVIDPAHSEATCTVRHAGVSKVSGRFGGIEGSLVVAADLTGSSVTATIDPATVGTGDEKRDAHLRSPDFFEVETFPSWSFTSTGVSADGDDYVISGDLTVHGITRTVQLATEFNGTAVTPAGDFVAGFSAHTQISRKDFDLTWNVALEAGGVLVGDKITITLEVEAIRQA